MTLLWATLLLCAQAGMPVSALSFTVDVDGPLAEVRIDQTFVNDGPDVIEAVYVFPLHEQAAVDAMHMVVGERFIEGVIAEREEAEATYEAALEQGHTAALTTQERPNLFTQRVGNIAPGDTVTVRLHVVQPVPHVDGAYELVLPLVAMPRFVPAEAWDDPSMPAHGLLEEGPPMFFGTTPLRAGLDIAIDSGLPFTGFEAVSHDVDLVHDGELALALADDVPVDRDFVLRWMVAQDRPVAAMHTMDAHAILTLEPPEAPQLEHVVPRELVWVIDQSCSMGGQPIELVRAAMQRALDHANPRDSLRILEFNDQVTGDAAARPLTPDVLRDARQRIHGLSTSGGTYLLDGVLEALEAPPDPERERTVVFLTDGAIGYELTVLQAIADQVGSGRLFAFGVGPAPNRWLLDEMAHFGGGATTWLRQGEDPASAVDRFVETIDRPVLTDITVDWGDWEVEDTWPQRMPALYAGQPLLLATRIVRRGTTDVVVRGRLGERPFETRVRPVEAEAGRAIPSTWARQAIAGLERQQIWGEDDDLADRILTTSLQEQVLSQYTAFVAVDRSTVVAPGGPARSVEQPASMPAGTTWGATSRSTMNSQDFLSRVPAGRSYQNAVAFSPGVVRRNPTYALDGTASTDATSAVYCVVAAPDQEPLAPPVTATDAGIVATDRAVPQGTNRLEADAGLARLEGAALASTSGHGEVSGPLVRDHAWAYAVFRHDQAAGPRDQVRNQGAATLTLQPNHHHRTEAHVAARQDRIATGPVPLDQQVVDGRLQHTWYLSPYVHFGAGGEVRDTALLGDRRMGQGARAHTKVEVEDHVLSAAVDVDRQAWRARGEGLSTWLGTVPPPTGEVTRIGIGGEEAWTSQRLEVVAGLRSDVTLGRAHLAPRASVAWHPGGDPRTTLRAGAARRFGHVGIATALLQPDVGLSRADEASLDVSQELVEDLTLAWTGTGRAHRDVPQPGGERVALSSWASHLELRKWWARRWRTQASWRYGRRTDAFVLVDDGSIPGFAHVFDGALAWDLPVNPWITRLEGSASAHLDPLGTLLPDLASTALPNAPRWTLGAQLSQGYEVRKGELLFELAVHHVELLEDPRDLSRYVLAQQVLPEQVGWGGLRVRGGLRATF